MSDAKPMPAAVADIRRDICKSCDAQCALYLAGGIDHADPAASCPRAWPRRWGPYGYKRGETFSRAIPPLPAPEGVDVAAPSADVQTSAQPRLAEPTAVELATNFAGAMARWGAAGFPVVSAEAYAARAAVCDACEFWDGKARFGLGKCRAPGCGCTAMKRWLATEKCPLRKWPV